MKMTVLSENNEAEFDFYEFDYSDASMIRLGAFTITFGSNEEGREFVAVRSLNENSTAIFEDYSKMEIDPELAELLDQLGGDAQSPSIKREKLYRIK